MKHIKNVELAVLFDGDAAGAFPRGEPPDVQHAVFLDDEGAFAPAKGHGQIAFVGVSQWTAGAHAVARFNQGIAGDDHGLLGVAGAAGNADAAANREARVAIDQTRTMPDGVLGDLEIIGGAKHGVAVHFKTAQPLLAHLPVQLVNSVRGG